MNKSQTTCSLCRGPCAVIDDDRLDDHLFLRRCKAIGAKPLAKGTRVIVAKGAPHHAVNDSDCQQCHLGTVIKRELYGFGGIVEAGYLVRFDWGPPVRRLSDGSVKYDVPGAYAVPYNMVTPTRVECARQEHTCSVPPYRNMPYLWLLLANSR